MIKPTSTDIIEANRERMFEWDEKGVSYFKMARMIGLGERNASVVSKWFIRQGIRRKAAR